MRKIKKIIKKIPIINRLAKNFYDRKKEKEETTAITNLLNSKKLSYAATPPPCYSIGYEPTIRCNLKCKMCYQGQTRALRREELNTEEVLSIFQKLKDKTKSIKLVGGEPLVRQDIFELIAFLDKNGVKVVLQSNCTLLDEEKIKILKNFKNLTDIDTSLDGPKEVHNAIRGISIAFEKLENAIKLIKTNMPDVPITIFSTLLIWDNLDNMKKLIDTAKGLGLDTINILFEQVYRKSDVAAAKKIFKNVFGWDENDYRINTNTRLSLFPSDLNSKELKKKLDEIRSYGFQKKCVVNFVPYNYYKNLDKYLGEKSGRVFCLKLLNPELRINQKGEVIWCDIIEKSFGSLLEKNPDEIWLSEEYQKFREYLVKNDFPICRRCCKASYI